MPRRRLAIWAGSLLAAVCVAALLAGPASAGTYSVYSCVGPSGETLPNLAWVQRRSVPAHTSAFTFGASCSDLTVTATPGTALATGESAGLAFDAPPGTTISGYVVRRSVTLTYPASGTKPALSAGLRRTLSSGDTYWGECEAVVANCSVAMSGTQSVGLSASSLQMGIECEQPSTGCAGTGIGTVRTTLAEARVDLTDDSAPSGSVTGGSLVGSDAASGTRTLEATISDVGGGVKSYWLAIDGKSGAVTNVTGSCAQTFTQSVPCPEERTAIFSVDLADYAPGAHTAVVGATDAAGNVGTLAPVTFTVPADVSVNVDANGKPVPGNPVLTTRKKMVDGKGGRALTIGGTLKTSSGSPIARATLDVTAINLGITGAATSILGTATTKANGTFAFKVKPSGARRVTFALRTASGAPSAISASTIVRQKLTLTAKRSQSVLRRGQALKISGKLAGTGGAASGIPVDVQVLAGRKWISVGSVKAASSGRYSWTHRFTRVTRPTIFRFRTVVKSSPTWLWPTNTSRPVQVLVNG